MRVLALPVTPPLVGALAVAWAALFAGCGDDGPPPMEAAEAMLAGPFAGPFRLDDATRLRLPIAEESLASTDVARIYWYAPGPAGRSLTFEVRAETTALAHGTVVHREEVPIPDGQTQGFFTVDPRELSEGGGRRVGGHFEWLAGFYSVRGSVAADEVGSVVYEVR